MTQLRLLTAGESHGRYLVAILEGIPSLLSVRTKDLQEQMARRKLGHGRGARQTIEDDKVILASGIRDDKTLGSPIALLIENVENAAEQCPADSVLTIPRPAHADLIGSIKFQHDDMRNVSERASARETAIRVAAATVARLFLAELDIRISSRVLQIGSIKDSHAPTQKFEEWNALADASWVRCLDPATSLEMVQEIDHAKASGDTLGGVFEVVATGLPLGLGSYTHWDRRLSASIAQSFMGLNAIKGVEIGDGFLLGTLKGSQAHDELFPGARSPNVAYQTNHAGGIVGGMSTGQPLVVRAVMKPIPTLTQPLQSFDTRTQVPAKAPIQRADVCAVPAAAVIAESLLCLVLAEAILEKFGGDSMPEILSRIKDWNSLVSSQ